MQRVGVLLALALCCIAQLRASPDGEEHLSKRAADSGSSYNRNYRYRPRNPYYYRRSCGNPGTPKNGYSWFQSVSAGSTVIHNCRPGLKLVGSKVRVCTNGRWNPSLPKCVVVDCGNPGAPLNGNKWVGSTLLGSVVKYTCNKNFKLVGSKLRVCQSNGRWSSSLPICKGNSCPNLAAPANGGIKVISNKIGGVAVYACKIGFVLNGNKKRVCQSNGQWTGQSPTCQVVDCGKLRDPKYGEVKVTSTKLGAKAGYRCNRGFRLVGSSTRVCQPNSQWDGKTPICKPTTCHILYNPRNGRVLMSSTRVGSVATYMCNSGFRLSGDRQRTCQINGQWTGRTPVCISVICKQLSDIDNGAVSQKNPAVAGSVAAYTCRRGFKLIGSSRRVCQSNGRYSGGAPSCFSIVCRQLQDPENGAVTQRRLPFVGSVAVYTCNNGFELNGNSRRVCQSNGRYSGEAPVCEAISCDQLDDIDNGDVDQANPALVGSVAVYTCSRGFRLVGASRRVCQRDGSYTEEEPVCVAIVCGRLRDPENGDVAQRRPALVGSVAVYSCDDGFELSGNSRRVCQLNGRYSGVAPVCEAIVCDQLDDIDNGGVDQANPALVDSVAVYSCSRGFRLVGASRRVCQRDGSYTEEEPVCVAIVCVQLANPANGVVSQPNPALVGSEADYTCNSGFRLSGSSRLVCRSNGRYSDAPPTCIPIVCGRLSNPSNGAVTQANPPLVGTSAFYTCRRGFELNGSSRRTCQSNGRYSGAAPTCEAIVCGQLENPNNGRVSQPNPAVVGSVAIYTCNLGFELNGVSRQVCQADGTYPQQPPVCVAIVCDQLSDPNNGQVAQPNPAVVGSEAVYTCNSGFELNGVSRQVCQADGTYSQQPPVCVAIVCDQLSDPNNGQVAQPNPAVVGSEAVYTCNSGFELNGVSRQVCQADGTYSQQPPVCVAIVCDQLSDPNNGQVAQPNPAVVGSEATYTCNSGFELNGVSRRVCQADGTYSQQPPVCVAIVCDQLSNPENGQVTQPNPAVVGSEATYTCNSGFELNGVSRQVCQADGTYSQQPPVCVAIFCGPLNNPSNGRVSQVTPPVVGSTATYSCNVGFRLVGANRRVCQADSSYTGVAPTCEGTFCARLSEPANGSIKFSSSLLQPGTTATYSCNKGFLLTGGDSVRTCQQDGTYTGNAPSCVAVKCSLLPNPSNGRVRQNGVTVGSQATYRCNRGFNLVGDSDRNCQSNGQWSGEVPICRASFCPNLRRIPNGAVKLPATSVGSVAEYSCNPGFQLVGASTRTCLENANWSGQEPSCEIINCGSLNNPENGKVTFSTTFGSVAVYSCNAQFVLVGQSQRRCQSNGQWSGTAPECQKITCKQLAAPTNGRLSLTQGNVFRSMAIYRCNVGYTLVGSPTRVCQRNGEWTGEAPLCNPKAIDCGPLESPENGAVRVPGTLFGFAARYSCSVGYKLVGLPTRVCQDNGRWSGIAPVCQPIICPKLLNPINGNVKLSGTLLGSKATYSCNKGFTLVGSSTRECQDNEEWSGSAPTCQVVDCGVLDSPANGRIDMSQTSLGTTATYSCNSGFILVGTATRTCQANGQWSGVAPTCQIVDCGVLGSPANGRIDVSQTSFGTTATYSCNSGFVLVGTATRTCQANGKWSGVAPTCRIVDCGVLNKPSNGRIDTSQTSFGTTATYSCNSGFVLVGTATRTCQINGIWSGIAPTCIVIDCGVLDNPTNGRIDTSQTSFGTTATYSCNSGFILVGTATRTCQINGIWSGIAPTCRKQVINCGTLANIENGRLEIRGTTVGSIARYSCLFGFLLAGNPVRTCLNDGTWSGNAPFCRPVDCGDLNDPANGKVDFTTTGFGAIARYRCSAGFRIVGDVSRTCKSDGTWSGAAPICQLIPTPNGCGDPGTPVNGLKTGSDYSIGAVVHYLCRPRFRLVGHPSRICQTNGKWSGSLPECVRQQGCERQGRVVDECGRMCICENGKLINCTRVRKDYAALTPDEQQRYINAVLAVATQPAYSADYAALIAKYKESYKTPAQNPNPSVSQFFVFSRYLLLEYENLLRRVDCRITIPYWDWTALPLTPYVAAVWDNQKGFGDSSRSDDRCVKTGPFRVGVFNVTSGAGGGCIRREYNMKDFPTRSIIERDLLTQPASEFDAFQRFFQVFIHTNVRCFVGGTMCSVNAANDPAYLVHLSMVDYVFDRWQRFSKQHLAARYAGDQTLLALAGSLTVTQFHNNDNLPNNVAVKYATPILTRVVVPDDPHRKVHINRLGAQGGTVEFNDKKPSNQNRMDCLSEDHRQIIPEDFRDYYGDTCQRISLKD